MAESLHPSSLAQASCEGQLNRDLELQSYDFHLPDELIAARPCAQRSQARLLVFDEETQSVTHSYMGQLTEFLPPQTQIFFNQSKVLPCRLRARRSTGGQVEIFVLQLSTGQSLLKSSGKKRAGEILHLPGEQTATISSCLDDGTFLLKFSVDDLGDYLEQFGQMPIPPYIREGQSDEQDKNDYQTSFAKIEGSVAAPTAGLHFDQDLLSKLAQQNFGLHYLTLHVGLGTFRPVKVDHILEHQMHSESYQIDESVLMALQNAESYKLAVGTTSLRAMESALAQAIWPALETQKYYETNIFLYPGKQVRSINALLTNFHLPKSTLLMLVSSLIGREKALELYAQAIEKGYRFFSYGDAMLIKRKSEER